MVTIPEKFQKDLGNQLSKREAREDMEEFDHDGDGGVGLQEFLRHTFFGQLMATVDFD